MDRSTSDNSPRRVTEFLEPVSQDDRLVDALSQGHDPSQGTDELAAMLLELRDDVTSEAADMQWIEDRFGPDDELAARRARPFMHGLVGAAAASLVFAGTAAALLTTGTVSVGQHHAVVELAGTLDQMDSKAAEGDLAGARELIVKARSLVGDMNERQPADAPAPETVRVTVPAKPVKPAPVPAPAPETVTETVTQTPAPEKITETVTVTPQTGTSTSATPTTEPTSTSTAPTTTAGN